MKANYTRDKVTVQTLMGAMTRLNLLMYAEFFGCKERAAYNFAVSINDQCKEYFNDYAGYGHDYAVARDIEKAGIDIDPRELPKGLMRYPVYRANYMRIVFYLGLTAMCLLKKGKSKATVQKYIDRYAAKLAERQWTDGKSIKELDRQLLEKLDIRIVE